jgi:hypothetical protein
MTDAYREIPPRLAAVTLRVEQTLGDASERVEIEWERDVPTPASLAVIAGVLHRFWGENGDVNE